VSRVHEQVDIDASPEHVFDFFDDVTNAEILVPSLVEITTVDALPNGGRRVAYTTRNRRGAIVEAVSEHLEYDPPHSTVTLGTQSGIETTSTRRFALNTDGGTRVEATIEWAAPVRYLGWLVGAPVRRPLRRSLRHGLRAAKAAIEAGPRAPSTPRG
jgi:hypothetical protein